MPTAIDKAVAVTGAIDVERVEKPFRIFLGAAGEFLLDREQALELYYALDNLVHYE